MGIMLLISMLRTAMATCTNTTGVVINEFLYDPAGTDTGHEWIELYNSGSTVDISGWMIKAGASVSSSSSGFGGVSPRRMAVITSSERWSPWQAAQRRP